MRLSVRALLLLAAIFLFLIALVVDDSRSDLVVLGLALFAGAFLADDLGVGRRPRV